MFGAFSLSEEPIFQNFIPGAQLPDPDRRKRRKVIEVDIPEDKREARNKKLAKGKEYERNRRRLNAKAAIPHPSVNDSESWSFQPWYPSPQPIAGPSTAAQVPAAISAPFRIESEPRHDQQLPDDTPPLSASNLSLSAQETPFDQRLTSLFEELPVGNHSSSGQPIAGPSTSTQAPPAISSPFRPESDSLDEQPPNDAPPLSASILSSTDDAPVDGDERFGSPLTPIPEELPAGDYTSSGHPSVSWANGWRTNLPGKVQEDGSFNFFGDEIRVQEMAKAPSAIDSPHVHYMEAFVPANHRDERLVDLKKKLAKGQVVVFQGARTHTKVNLKYQEIKDYLNLLDESRLDVHDAERRSQQHGSPHLSLNLQQFLEIKDRPTCVLDVPTPDRNIPELIRHLDEGFGAWSGTQRQYPSQSTPTDIFKSRSWALLHHQGYHTYAHHDAGGYMTFIEVSSGAKCWGIIEPKGYRDLHRRSDLHKAFKNFRMPKTGDFRFGFEERSEVFIIFAKEGDMIIMPPGIWHEVQTPLDGVCLGGHDLTYDTLHLTEVSRRFDKTYSADVTNATHPSVYVLLIRMLCYMPSLPHQVFYRKPLTALCRMVLWKDQYEDGQAKQPEDDDVATSIAENIAKLLVEHYHLLANKRDYKDYLFEGSGGWMDPGEEIIFPDDLLANFR